MNKNKVVFLTGVTGGLGREFLKLLLQKTDDRFFLLVRPRGPESHEKRVEKLLQKMGLNGESRGRLRVLSGDITSPRLGLGPEDWQTVVRETDEFYHSAALTNLGAARDEAEQINLKGTLHCLELAREGRRKGKLERFYYFSTAFVAGSLTPIHAQEDSLPEAPVFGNAYEATKFQAERRVRDAAGEGLPVTIFRPSIVVGSSRDGAVSEFNVIYPFLRLFAHGILKQVPSDLDHSFNVVPIDFVVESSFAIARRPDSLGKTFHLVSERPPTLRMLLEIKEEYRGFPPVEVVPPEDFSVDSLSSEERNVFSTLQPYLGYLGSTLTFDTTNTRSALKDTGISFPRTDRAFLKKLVDYALSRGYFLPAF